MKELDDLREWVRGWIDEHGINRRLDRIEQAIAERYMELPLDADSKPWHLGDHNESGDCVRAIGHKTIVYDFEENDCDWAHMRTHEKRTCECGWHGFVDGWGYDPPNFCPNCGGKVVG